MEYADAVVGRFGMKPDGSKTPNVRTVARPLLNLFVGEPSGRKWRRMLDVALLKKPATVAEVVEVPVPPAFNSCMPLRSVHPMMTTTLSLQGGVFQTHSQVCALCLRRA